MKTVSAFLLVAVLLATPAFAGDACWQFKPGQTFTYELNSEFHYISRPMTAAGPGGEGSRGWQTNEGGTTTEDPQWETIVLKATVLNIGDDGAARIDFVVESVRIETRFDSSGDHAEWDSKKSKTTDIVGYKRYEAIVGHKFQAIVGADGAVREVKNGAWPVAGTQGMKTLAKNEREERAAVATHDPTAVEAWLNLIFWTAPGDQAEYKRTIKIPAAENLEVKADGREQVGKYECARSKMRSHDKERGITEKDLNLGGAADLQNVAAGMVAACQKKGCSWFSRKAGCMVKVELEGATEMSQGRNQISTHMKWDVQLKDRGFVELPSGGNTPSEGQPEVTPTK